MMLADTEAERDTCYQLFPARRADVSRFKGIVPSHAKAGTTRCDAIVPQRIAAVTHDVAVVMQRIAVVTQRIAAVAQGIAVVTQGTAAAPQRVAVVTQDTAAVTQGIAEALFLAKKVVFFGKHPLF
jgi:hypothetical protein